MSKETLLNLIAENVDKLITLDVGVRSDVDKIYPIMRKFLKRPMAMTAAEKLKEAVKPGDYVFLTTGFFVYEWLPSIVEETDGPLGAAALGRSLQIGLEARPIFLAHEKLAPMMELVAKAANFNIFPLEQFTKLHRSIGCSAIGFPTDDEEAKEKARSLIDKYNPKAIIAVEKVGPNKKGVYHGFYGDSMQDFEPHVGHLFDEANRRGILTIGIGDGCGAEICYGPVFDEVRPFEERYSQCGCGCGEGILCATKVTVPIIATVSNWGAYGVSACLAALLDKPDVTHDRETEFAMLRNCLNAGGYDGVNDRATFSVDGLHGQIHGHIVELLREIATARVYKALYVQRAEEYARAGT